MHGLLLVLLAAGLGGTHPGHDGPKARKPARTYLPLSTLARCSGDVGCRACKNCSHCGHCAGGGRTCGVCAPAPVRTYRATPPRTRSYGSGGGSSRSTTPARTKTVLVVDASYTVAASTLNLRAAPSAEAEVLRVLEGGDVVTVLELVDAQWAKVSVESADLGDVEGYVARAYLSSQR